jgi:hypothetical protein
MPAARKDKMICTKCGGPNDRGPKMVWCNACQRTAAQKWAKENREKRRQSVKKYDKSPLGIAKHAAWREANKDHLKKWGQANYKKRRKRAIAQAKARRERLKKENAAALRAYETGLMKQWRAEHPEQSKQHNRNQHRTRYGKDTQYTLRKKIRRSLTAAFNKYLDDKSDGKHWETIVGYKCHELEARLRSTIPVGFTWEDFLSGVLEIDHIRPVVSFTFTSRTCPEIRECWALSNLQLLTDPVNRMKGAKLNFTPP